MGHVLYILGSKDTTVEKSSQSLHSNLVLFLGFWFTDVFSGNDYGIKKDTLGHSTIGFHQIEGNLAQWSGFIDLLL